MGSEFSIRDLFKSSVISSAEVSTLAVSDIVVNLTVTLLLSLFSVYVYRKFFMGVLYTLSFNVSLVMVSLVTSLIIMTISSNLILSLGMVGALSIVRFRTAVKDAIDIGFMFWAIAVGIANGAGFFLISIVGSVFIAAVLWGFSNFRVGTTPYLLVVQYDPNSDDSLCALLLQSKGGQLKSKTIRDHDAELTYEVRVSSESSLVSDVRSVSGVRSVALVAYNGDYVS